jgi:error-prone DNA polymerase
VARAEIPRDIATHLATAGAFTDLAPSRREALWRVAAIHDTTLFRGIEQEDAEPAPLAPMSEEELLGADYESTGVSASGHPMRLLRESMKEQGVGGYLDLMATPHGSRITVGGLAVTRQRPATASGVIFITLEDEAGHMNLVVFPNVYEKHRTLAREAALLVASGKVQRTGAVVNLIVDTIEPMRRSVAEPKGRYTRFGGGHSCG